MNVVTSRSRYALFARRPNVHAKHCSIEFGTRWLPACRVRCVVIREHGHRSVTQTQITLNHTSSPSSFSPPATKSVLNRYVLFCEKMEIPATLKLLAPQQAPAIHIRLLSRATVVGATRHDSNVAVARIIAAFDTDQIISPGSLCSRTCISGSAEAALRSYTQRAP